MRDSRLGTYGTLVILVAFVSKAAALQALAAGAVVPALVTAHTLGRAAIPVLALVMPAARSDGLGKEAGRPEPADVGIALAIAIAITFVFLAPASALCALAVAATGGAVMALIAWRQIGGVTGDVYGAAEQVIEVCVLLLLAARMA
jgi:adenosylcobinamide-GDP ribazoletransferase